MTPIAKRRHYETTEVRIRMASGCGGVPFGKGVRWGVCFEPLGLGLSETLHDGAVLDEPAVPGPARGVGIVAKLGLELFNRFEVDLQLPDQPGLGDHDVELQVAVPRRRVFRIVIAVEAVLDPADIDPVVGLEPEDRVVDLGDVLAHNARAAEVLRHGCRAQELTGHV